MKKIQQQIQEHQQRKLQLIKNKQRNLQYNRLVTKYLLNNHNNSTIYNDSTIYVYFLKKYKLHDKQKMVHNNRKPYNCNSYFVTTSSFWKHTSIVSSSASEELITVDVIPSLDRISFSSAAIDAANLN